jgi:non-specific serine/threonine protein kinase
MQESISRSIVEALRVTLTAEEDRKLAQRPIADVRAYEWYLRARQEMLRFTPDGLGRALEYLANSEAIEGENIVLLAAKGEAYWQYVNGGLSSDPLYLDKAEACARRILALDPQSPHGHRVSGLVRLHRGDVEGALRALKRALDLAPNDPDSLMWASLFASVSGKTELAERWSARLVEIDPVTPFVQAVPATVAWMRGDSDVALARLAAHPEAMREHHARRLIYGLLLAAAGRLDEADTVLAEVAQREPGHAFGQLALAYRHAFSGDSARVRAILTPAVTGALESDPQYCWLLARCFALVNDVDNGIAWVRAAVEHGFINHALLARRDPFLANLHPDPRYQALMHEVEQRTRALDI